VERRLVLPSLLDCGVRIPPHVVYRTFALETVLVNLEKGFYHGVNPTGGRMLEVLERSPTVRDAAARLADEYAQPVERMEADLCAFCSDLRDRGLIEVHE
jgi:Coenzyme PQQ synthesis protein D (PqqD)